jgi:uncharacterized protein YaaN involved in tellurite resistance
MNSTALVERIAMLAQVEKALTPEQLQKLGLSHADLPEVARLVGEVRLNDAPSIYAFGPVASEAQQSNSDALLDQVQSPELAQAGELLSSVVEAAKSIQLQEPGALTRLPILGAALKRLRNTDAPIAEAFETAREKIDTFSTEIVQLQERLSARVQALDLMYADVMAQVQTTGRYVAAGQTVVHAGSEIVQRHDMAGSALLQAERGRQTTEALVMLEQRLFDLRVVQQSLLQTLPVIRMIQANYRTHIEKFRTICQLTIPAWKRQFIVALSLQEQTAALKLSQRIDDTTNSMFKRNAELLRATSVQTARSGMRPALDVAALRQVHNTLLNTVQDVMKINQEGVQSRQQMARQIEAMRHDVVSFAAGKTEVVGEQQ